MDQTGTEETTAAILVPARGPVKGDSGAPGPGRGPGARGRKLRRAWILQGPGAKLARGPGGARGRSPGARGSKNHKKTNGFMKIRRLRFTGRGVNLESGSGFYKNRDPSRGSHPWP